MRKSVFGAALLAIVVDALGFGLVYPLMTELFAGDEGRHMAEGMSLGWRHFYLGLSFLLYPLATFFSASWISDLSKKYGRKRVLMLCMSGQTVSFLMMGAGIEFVSIAVLLIGRGLSGLMAGSQLLAQETILEQNRPGQLSIMTCVVAAGIAFGPVLGGVFSDEKLVSWFTLATPFYLAGLLGLITLIAVWRCFSSHAIKRSGGIDWEKPLMVLREAFTPRLRLISGVFFLMQLGFSLFFQLIQVFVSTVYDFPTWKIGLFNGWMGIAFALVVLFGIQFFLSYFSIARLSRLSLGLTGILIIIPMLFPGEPLVWVMSFCAAGFNMLAYGSLISFFSHALDAHKGINVLASLMAVAWVITGFSTNLIDSVSLRWLIGIGGLLLISSSILSFRFPSSAKN